MKHQALLIAAFLFSLTLFSQKGFRAGIGISTGLPVGALADNLKTGIGANAQGDYFFSTKFSAGVFINYVFFGGQNNTTDRSNSSSNTSFQELNAQVSLLNFGGAIDYHFNAQFFLGIGIGAGHFKTDSSKTIETTINNNGSGGVLTATLHGDNGTGLLLSPRIGFNRKKLQAILSYNSVKNAYPRSVITGNARNVQYIGLTVNYRLK